MVIKETNYHILVCGGRTNLDYEYVDNILSTILNELDVDDCEFVSGGCKGIDLLGEQFAKTHNYTIKQFLPDWKKFGRAAGIKRNAEMINYIKKFDNSIVIAFWNGESHGTKFTIENAKKNDIPVYVFRYDKNELTEGVRYENNNFIFDYVTDKDTDIIKLTNIEIKPSKFHHSVYYYGYKANCKTDIYHNFIKYLKMSDITGDIKQFVDIAIDDLINKVTDIDYVIYPQSHCRLNDYMAKRICDNFNCYKWCVSKNTPNKVQFDWEKFYSKFKGNDEYKNKITNYISNFMNVINKSNSFNFTKQVPPKYRQYITNFLIIDDTEYINYILNSKNILIVDDILSTGATINEIITMLNNVGYKGNIIVFSLINNR